MTDANNQYLSRSDDPGTIYTKYDVSKFGIDTKLQDGVVTFTINSNEDLKQILKAFELGFSDIQKKEPLK